MPNVFDQFDPPSTQTAAPVISSSNVFDQFDTHQSGNNIFDQFDTPTTPPPPSTTPASDFVSRAIALAHTPSPQWLQPAEERARAFVEGAGVPGSLKDVKDFVTRSPIQDVKDIYNDVTQIPERVKNIGQTISGSPAATVARAPLSPEAFGVYGTAAGMLIPAAHEALKAPEKAGGTIPAPAEAPPVVGNEQFARVTPENERAGAAVPADNPAPAQSTILEGATQPEPKPVVPITEENAAQAATDIGGLSFGGVQSWPADSGIPSTLEFTITEPGKETTLSVPPGITPEELIARRDQKLADFAAKEPIVTLHHATPKEFQEFDPNFSTPTGLGGKGVFFATEPQTAAYGDKVVSVQVPKSKIAWHADIENDPTLKQGGNIDQILQDRGYAGVEGPVKGEIILYDPNEFLNKPTGPAAAQPEPANPVQHGEFAQPGYTAIEPKVTDAEPHVSAIANRFTQERAAKGEIGEVAPRQGVSTIDLTQRGLNMAPEEVNQHISDVMNDAGGDPKLQASAIRGEEARLSKQSHDLSRAAEANPTDINARVAADNAFKDLTDFHNGPVAKLKNNWHAQGMAMQGEVPVDLSTLNGLREAWLKDTGKAPPTSVEPTLRKAAERVRKTVAEENGAMQQLGQEIDKVTRSRKLPTADEVRASIRERMGLGPCKV